MLVLSRRVGEGISIYHKGKLVGSVDYILKRNKYRKHRMFINDYNRSDIREFDEADCYQFPDGTVSFSENPFHPDRGLRCVFHFPSEFQIVRNEINQRLAS